MPVLSGVFERQLRCKKYNIKIKQSDVPEMLLGLFLFTDIENVKVHQVLRLTKRKHPHYEVI
jgi:hypothetical protein